MIPVARNVILMKSFLRGIILLVLPVTIAISGAAFAKDTGNDTNDPSAGPLGDLSQLIIKGGTGDELPAHLAGLLWPEAGKRQQKLAVQKSVVPGKKEGEGRVFFVRPDNHEIVLMKHAETVSDDGESKTREETYYRTSPDGNLALVLTARLRFTKDLADNDILKDVNLQTYGQITADASKPLPITPEIRSEFETEKKFWLKQEKKLKKSERRREH